MKNIDVEEEVNTACEALNLLRDGNFITMIGMDSMLLNWVGTLLNQTTSMKVWYELLSFLQAMTWNTTIGAWLISIHQQLLSETFKAFKEGD